MKRLFFILLISTSLIYVSSCKKESNPCEAVICQNGGVCDEQGNCNCPPEFEGINCENLASPKEIKINKITVTNFNETNGSAGDWDSNDGPDLYVVFSQVDEFTSLAETETIENCEFGNEYEYMVNWSMDGEGTTYYFYLFDEDNDFQNGIHIIGYDWMGETSIHPMDYRENKPTTIDLLSQFDDEIGLRLEVEWIFE